MSPRRLIHPSEEPLFTGLPTRSEAIEWAEPAGGLQQRRPGGILSAILVTIAAVALSGTAIGLSTLFLVNHESHYRTEMNDVDVLGFVKSFMAGFTSVDPRYANNYVDQILANATGDFAKQYRDQENEVLVHIAQGEQTTGTPLDAGVERWNDDGSANVLVATDVKYKSPDGKQVFDNTIRWVVTARREGNQWKISNLQQMV